MCTLSITATIGNPGNTFSALPRAGITFTDGGGGKYLAILTISN